MVGFGRSFNLILYFCRQGNPEEFRDLPRIVPGLEYELNDSIEYSFCHTLHPQSN